MIMFRVEKYPIECAVSGGCKFKVKKYQVHRETKCYVWASQVNDNMSGRLMEKKFRLDLWKQFGVFQTREAAVDKIRQLLTSEFGQAQEKVRRCREELNIFYKEFLGA